MRLPLLLLLAVALAAVEEGPFQVTKVIDGDIIEVLYSPPGSMIEPIPTQVRLLYVDTPEGTDNDHGKAMPEGQAAGMILGVMLGESASIRLWAPGDSLKRDRHGRILACVCPMAWAPASSGKTPETVALQVAIVGHGLSVYWRKHGDAPEPLHSQLLEAQAKAEAEKRGIWATAPDWMRDKANERAAPEP